MTRHDSASAFLISFWLLSAGAIGQTLNGTDGANRAWGTAGNWMPDTVPNATDAVVNITRSSGGGNRQIQLGGGTFTIGELNWNVLNVGDNDSLRDGTINFVSTDGVSEFNFFGDNGGNVQIRNGATLQIGDGQTLIITNASSAANSRLNFTTDGAGGHIAGAGTIIFRDGSGVAGNLRGIRLQDANAGFTGNFILESGSLELFNAAGLGSGTLTGRGGQVLLNGDYTIANNVVLDGGFLLSSDSGTTRETEWNGTVSGDGDLAISSTMDARFNGNNTFTGQLILDGGRIRAGSNTAFGGSTIVVTANDGIYTASGGNRTIANNWVLNGTLDVTGGSNDSVFTGNISGTGGLLKSSGGLLTLAGNNTFTGATEIDDGILILTGSSGLGNTSGISFTSNDAALGLLTNGETTFNLGAPGTVLMMDARGKIGAMETPGDSIAILANNIQFNTDRIELFAESNSRLYIEGDIIGNGDIRINDDMGDDEVRFRGGEKTFTGDIEVRDGRLRIDDDGLPVNLGQLTLRGGNLRFGQGGDRTYTLGANVGGSTIEMQRNNAIEKTDTGSATLTNNIVLNAQNSDRQMRFRAREEGSSLILTGDISQAGGSAAGASVSFNTPTVSNDFFGTVRLMGDYNAPDFNVEVVRGFLHLGPQTTLNGLSFDLQSPATLVLDIQDAATFGSVMVSGDADLADGSMLRPIFTGGLDSGALNLDVITSGTLNNAGIGLVASPVLQAQLVEVGGTTLQLQMDVNYAAPGSGLNDNAQAVAGLLGSGAGTGALGQLQAAALSTGSSAELQQLYESIAAEELGALTQTAFSNSNALMRGVMARSQSLREGNAGLNMASLRGTTDWNFETPILLADTSGRPLAIGRQETSKWSVFGNVTGSRFEQDRTAQQGGFESATQGFLAGVDHRISPNLVVGAFGGYDRSRTQFDRNRGWSGSNTATFGGYGSWLTDNWYVTASAAYSRHDIETERLSALGTARGDADADQVTAMIGGGYDFRHGRWTYGPTAMLTYSHMWIDPFTESGAPIAQSFRAQDADSLQMFVGGRASYLFPGDFVSFRPEVRAGYNREFLNDGRVIESSLAGGGPTFGIRTQDAERDWALIGGSINAVFSDSTTAFVSYDAEVGRSDYVGHTISGGVRWFFPGGPPQGPVMQFSDQEKDWRDVIWESPVGRAAKFVNLHGRAHFQYDYGETESKPGTLADPNDPEMINRLFVRRLRVGIERDLGAGFYAEATGEYDEFAPEGRGAPLGLFSALFGWRPIEEFDINFGYDKVPFSWEENTSSAQIKTVERSAANRTFTKLGDIGEQHIRLGVNGRFRELVTNVGPLQRYDFHYAVAIAQPSPEPDALWDADYATTEDNFVSPSYYIRLHNELRTSVGTFDVGADFAYVAFDFRDNPGAEAIGYSPFLNYNYGWFNLMAQWMGMSYTGEAGDPAVSPSGFTIQPSIFVHPKWELVGMYSQFDTNGDEAIRHNQSVRNAPTFFPDSRRFDDIRQYYFGFNHYIKGNDIKFTAGVEYNELGGARANRAVSAEDSWMFRARLQVLF